MLCLPRAPDIFLLFSGKHGRRRVFRGEKKEEMEGGGGRDRGERPTGR